LQAFVFLFPNSLWFTCSQKTSEPITEFNQAKGKTKRA